jgi:anti-sigma regulatory factor (Ser/Thr protein kinase)
MMAVANAPREMHPPLTLRIPSRPQELSELRRAMRAWLADAGVAVPIADDMILASGEAAANAIEHAYDGFGEGIVEVSLAIEGGLVVASVTDHGRWRAYGATEGRGRGIPLIAALVDDVDIRSEEGGTVVTMRKAIHEAIPGEGW